MTTSTSFAQMANNQSISLSSALRANTPPTKGQTTSHKFLTLSIFFLLSFLCTTHAWADYTIAFKSTDGSDGSTAQTTNANLISSGGTNVSTISATRAYNGKSGYGIKLGSSDKTGNVIMTLANSAQIKASKLVVKAAYYDSNKTLKVTVTYTDNTTTTQTITPASSLTDYDVLLTDTKTIKQIKIESVTASKGRMYCHSIKVVAASAAVTTYTITWKNADGTTLKTEEVVYGTTPSYTGTTPTKAATEQYTYTHDGWTPSVVAVTGNATYTATFTKTLRTYTITWKNDDGTILETDENVLYGTTPSYDGDKPIRPATAQCTYDFNGWNPTITTVTSDATYTAKYTAIVKISWMVNGQSTGYTTCPEGTSVTPPTVNPIPCGDVIAGWTDAENGEYVHGASTLYEGAKPSIVVTENKTYYAVFADYVNE